MQGERFQSGLFSCYRPAHSGSWQQEAQRLQRQQLWPQAKRHIPSPNPRHPLPAPTWRPRPAPQCCPSRCCSQCCLRQPVRWHVRGWRSWAHLRRQRNSLLQAAAKPPVRGPFGCANGGSTTNHRSAPAQLSIRPSPQGIEQALCAFVCKAPAMPCSMPPSRLA